MVYAENMMAILKYLLVIMVSINAFFLVLVFSRRFWRNLYFRVYDAARRRHSGTVRAFATGELSVTQAWAALKKAESAAELDAVHQMLLDATDDGNRHRISDLLFALGFVGRWAEAAFGEERGWQMVNNFRNKLPQGAPPARNRVFSYVRRLRFLAVGRAIAVFKLGHLAPDFAFSFAQEALRDPSPDVRGLAIIALGRSRHPAAVGALVEELRQAVAAHNEVSPRYIKAALLHYQVEDLEHFQPFLLHAQPRVRFFVVDAIREICDRAASRAPLHSLDFPLNFTQLFLKRVARDDFADVRARSAGVIKHFRTSQTVAALHSLLQDGNEYVRMWACRSIRAAFYAELIPDLAVRLGDTSWRVREDAVNSLVAFGQPGTRAMYSCFESGTDLLICEHIGEAIQRWGLMTELVAMISGGAEEASLAEGVCRQMALLGMTSAFKPILESATPLHIRLLLRGLLREAPRPRLHLSPRERFEFLPPSSPQRPWTTPALACAVAKGD